MIAHCVACVTFFAVAFVSRFAFAMFCDTKTYEFSFSAFFRCARPSNRAFAGDSRIEFQI